MSDQAPKPNPAPKTAISPRRADDFPEWYQAVLAAADMAENSEVRGCMIIKPWGYGIWELIQAQLDRMFKATGHKNAYFPLFIPLSYLEKEAAHVAGFAKECAVVTHHRLEVNAEGKLVPTGKLTEPLVVRPTSETIIGAAYAKWVQSYRGALGNAPTHLPAHDRISLAGGPYRARDRGRGAGGNAPHARCLRDLRA
jgi:prolyl-tRNA synthetase